MARLYAFVSVLAVLSLSLTFAFPLGAQTPDGVVARCGPSTGSAHFFGDAASGGDDWQKDGISNGKIVLVRLGDEWDIQFDDAIGAAGYRNDGARVIPLGGNDQILRVGAFHENYVDIYSFDLIAKTVAWTSSKTFPFAKVGAYLADCK